jgi:adenylate cyclase
MTAAKILAVDDEPDFELLLTQRFRRQIREKEFEFRFAHHGEEALERLAAEPDIDLTLLDIRYPRSIHFDSSSSTAALPHMA